MFQIIIKKVGWPVFLLHFICNWNPQHFTLEYNYPLVLAKKGTEAYKDLYRNIFEDTEKYKEKKRA